MKKVISPHVQIYKFPITAISSISTRLSGFYLSSLFVAGGLYCLNNNNYLENKYKELDYNYKRIINQTLIIPTAYHSLGGIRHFIWDKYPKLLENNKVGKSSIFLFTFTLGTSLLIDQLHFFKNNSNHNQQQK